MAAKTVAIGEAQGHLDEIIEKANAGDEVILEKGGQPVAKLVALPRKKPGEELPPRTVGNFRGALWIADDFDAPLSGRVWGIR